MKPGGMPPHQWQQQPQLPDGAQRYEDAHPNSPSLRWTAGEGALHYDRGETPSPVPMHVPAVTPRGRELPAVQGLGVGEIEEAFESIPDVLDFGSTPPAAPPALD